MFKIFAGLTVVAVAVVAVMQWAAAYSAEIAYALDWLTFALQVAIWLCMATPVIALVAFVVLVIRRQARKDRQLTDGAWKMIRRRVRRWYPELPAPVAVAVWLRGEELFLDPNRMEAAGWRIDFWGNIVEHAPAAGWGTQRIRNQQHEASNMIRAWAPGDEAVADKWGSTYKPGRFAPPKMPREEPAGYLTGSDPEEVEGEFVPAPISFTQALQQSTPTTLPLGVSPHGDLVYLDLLDTHHSRFHGATQRSGKTNLIIQLALAGLLQGGHVIVIDRREFKDWAFYAEYMELVDGNAPGAFIGTLQQVERIYRQRDAMLRNAGARNLSSMPNAPGRIFVVIGEFGSACRDAGERGELEEITRITKNIASEAAATGVHLWIEDQARNRNWPPEIRGNIVPISGWLPEDTAKQGGYARAHQLQKYHFLCTQGEFVGWDMNAESGALLRRLPALQQRLIDPDLFPTEPAEGAGAVRGPVRGAVRESVRGDDLISPPKTPIKYDPARTANANSEREQSQTEENDPVKWAIFVREWLDDHPEYVTTNKGDTELAKQMAAAEGDIKPFTQYKSIAHQMLVAERKRRALPVVPATSSEPEPPAEQPPAEPTGLERLINEHGIDPADLVFADKSRFSYAPPARTVNYTNGVGNGNGHNGHTNGNGAHK